MKYVILIIGIILSILGFVQGYRYIFDFDVLSNYGKGYVLGAALLLIAGLALIIASFYVKRKK